MIGYNSPFSYRYGTKTMREAWSQVQRYRLLSGIWTKHQNRLAELGSIPLAKFPDPAKSKSDEQVEELILKAREAEKEVGHEIVAYLSVYSKHAPVGVPIMAHAGLTSSDVDDQAVLTQILFSLCYLYYEVRSLILNQLGATRFKGSERKWLMGRTHLQPAEPTTLLHRFLLYIQDLTNWLNQADLIIKELSKYRGLMSGSVGNYLNEIVAVKAFANSPSIFPIKDKRAKSQTLPRYLELQVANLLDQLAAILHKAAFDYRLESGFGNTYEGEAENRIGSSAMPYKRNPINAESINSLCRHVHHLCNNAWDNMAWQGLERTLDDSANRRAWLPEAFIAMSEILERAKILFKDYEMIESIDPYDWNKLWIQAREKAFNTISAAATRYDQPKQQFKFGEQEIIASENADLLLLEKCLNRARKVNSWFFKFKVGSPYDLLGEKL